MGPSHLESLLMRALILIALLSLSMSAQDKRPDVHLNHAFVVPDAENYEAIRNSEFVKQFAVFEERTTHRKDITYTGFYLYGRDTYFEFLKPDERSKVGDSAIAFGVDRTGDLDLLRKRVEEAAGMKTEVQTITRSFNGKDVDWFRSLKRKDASEPSLGVWTLEYVPTFLTEWHPSPKVKSSVRRVDALKRYAEVVKQKPENKVMANVSAIWLTVPGDLEQAKKECAALGLEVSSVAHSPVLCGKGRELSIFIRPAGKGAPPGINAVVFTLGRKTEKSIHQFGKSTLKVVGDFATWVFQPGFEPFPGYKTD